MTQTIYFHELESNRVLDTQIPSKLMISKKFPQEVRRMLSEVGFRHIGKIGLKKFEL